MRQWVYNNLSQYISSFDDSVSQGQYDSKIWMHEELSKIYLNDVHVDIIGSWFAFPMIEFLIDLYDVKQIDLYDKDVNCHGVVAQYINHFDLDIKIAQFGDIFERTDYRRRQLIINTACEHMNDMSALKPMYKDLGTVKDTKKQLENIQKEAMQQGKWVELEEKYGQ